MIQLSARSRQSILLSSVMVCCALVASSAQAADDWVLLAGTQFTNSPGVYTTAPTEMAYPHPRTNAVTWTDDSGNFWLFGGETFAPIGSGSVWLNDLWKYSPGTGEWRWVAGYPTSYAAPAYPPQKGLVGIPGARIRAAGFKDPNGDLWLFGGRGIDINNTHSVLNDLWKFDIETEKWIWVAGSNTSDDQGTSPTRVGDVGYPSARESCMVFQAQDGSVYVYGGSTGSFPAERYSELWHIDFDNPDEWTWVTGSGDLNEPPDFPATIGDPGYPGAREWAMGWVDFDGHFWLFGGQGNYNPGVLSDIWRYETSSETWRWFGGTNSVVDHPSAHGMPGDPGRRYLSSTYLAGKELWVFGGGAHTPGFARMNDLWSYNISEQKWIYIDGTENGNDSGTYPISTGGTGQPAGRSGAAAWTSADGETHYLFGGQTSNGYLSDLWVRNTNPNSSADNWYLY